MPSATRSLRTLLNVPTPRLSMLSAEPHALVSSHGGNECFRWPGHHSASLEGAQQGIKGAACSHQLMAFACLNELRVWLTFHWGQARSRIFSSAGGLSGSPSNAAPTEFPKGRTQKRLTAGLYSTARHFFSASINLYVNSRINSVFAAFWTILRNYFSAGDRPP